jgi:hypothetical protein
VCGSVLAFICNKLMWQDAIEGCKTLILHMIRIEFRVKLRYSSLSQIH